MNLKNISIRAKFILLLLFCMSSFLLMGFLTIRSSQKALLNAQLQATSDILINESNRLIGRIHSLFKDVVFLSVLPPISGINEARELAQTADGLQNTNYNIWVDRLNVIFESIAQARPNYRQIRFIDEKGNELVRVNSDGTNISRIIGNKLQSKKGKQYFIEAMKLERETLYVSDVTLNIENNKIQAPYIAMLRVAKPVFDGLGRRRGLIIINLDARSLMRDSKMPGGGSLYLVNSDGYYLHHSDESHEFGFQLNTEYNLGLDDPDTMEKIKIMDRSIEYLAQEGRVGGFQKIYFDSNDKERYWILFGTVPEKIIFTDIVKLRNKLIFICLTIVLILIFVVFTLSQSIITAITTLKVAASRIGKGLFDSRVEGYGERSEVGQLAASFNRMAEDLHKTTVSKDYVDNIIESMTDMLIVIDSNERIRSVNPATCSLLGYKEEEFVGKDVRLLFVEEQGSFKGTRLKKLIEQRSIRNSDMTFKTKSGERIPVSFSGSVMKSKEGKIEGIVCIARDMREMKRLFQKEKELTSVAMEATEAEKRKTVELENAFGELEKSQDMTLDYMEDLEVQRKEFEKQYNETKQKSKALEQAQTASLNIMEDLDLKRKEIEEREKKLKETQAMLVQAGKLSAMGQLGAGIAHELNQPLAAIRGYTQVLIEEINNSDPHLADLKIIEEQTSRMGTIVNNIRTFARDSKFKWDLIDIHKPIEDAFMLLTTQLTNHNIEVAKNYSRDIPQIKADSNQLQQVFINLISNARDALDKNDGGKIWVNTRTLKLGKQKSDWKVEISITNNGTPIPEEIINQIFDPFFTTKDPGKGTGLGLSISYGIIKDHQGEITAVNKEDGVEFVISLPVDAKGNNAKDI